jgi:hypothetical protein
MDMTIERIDGNKGYEPSNVRWATRKEQNRNTSRNHFVTYRGQTKTIAEWSEVIGIGYSTLCSRINNKWPLSAALSSKRFNNHNGPILGKIPLQIQAEKGAA